MKVGVLIPSRGDRPDFLCRAKLYLLRQTRQPDRVLVVDYVPTSDQPDITQRYRMGCEVLFRAGCDVVLFMEDDDWYSPKYVELMTKAWDRAGRPVLFGINKTLYYNIRTQRHTVLKTKDRASMMSMCASPEVLNIPWPADNDPFTDYKLAQHCKVHTDEVSKQFIAVGIKHGVGKCGGQGHNPDWKQYTGTDVDYKYLQQLIGNDANFYRKMAAQMENKTVPPAHKIKLAIVTGVWKRPEVFEMFAKGVHELESACPQFEIITIVAGSEGPKTRRMVEAHGFKYIEVANDPLAAKMNATTLMAQQLNVDYVLCLGSDDVVSPGLMREYEKHMRKRVDYIAVTDFYFYDTVTRSAAYWGGYRDERRKGHTAGAGRVISRRLMAAWNWRPWELKHNHVLDNSMQEKLLRTKHSSAIFSMKERGVYALDIKSDTNMTPFKLWDNTVRIPSEELKALFPYVIK
jgi:hypothetical protein